MEVEGTSGKGMLVLGSVNWRVTLGLELTAVQEMLSCDKFPKLIDWPADKTMLLTERASIGGTLIKVKLLKQRN